jgi:hypothetical protein
MHFFLASDLYISHAESPPYFYWLTDDNKPLLRSLGSFFAKTSDASELFLRIVLQYFIPRHLNTVNLIS